MSPWVIVAIVISAVSLIPIVILVATFGIGSYGWQQAAKSGNETATLQQMANLRKFQAQYASRNRGNFGDFDELVRRAGLDDRFRGDQPIVNGYFFKRAIQPASTGRAAFYSISADPMSGGGTRHFYTDSSISSITFTQDSRPASPTDPSI